MDHKVIDMEPCAKCAGFMKLGIILLTIDEKKCEKGWNREALPNPFRTGGFFVVKDEAVKRFMPEAMFQWAKKHRFMFIEHEAAVQLGLFEAAGEAEA